ncbi:MAG: hypothetical protein MUF00_08360 [Gemmatimonadaceae bacterium]|jgi:hypothetical protein|nr:hypothetical protein [Gemmatimonadaceae bacterium]
MSRAFLALALLAGVCQAQSTPAAADSARWRVTLTVFRSPGTGLQISRGRLAVFAGHYPTVFRRGGADRTTHFIRVGVAAYARAHASSPYVSLSIAPSLTDGWPTSGLLDAGWRQGFTSRVSGQLGVALLVAPSLRTSRINPTVGLGVRL